MTVCECGYEWGVCCDGKSHYCMKPIGHDGECECECGATVQRYDYD